MTNDEILMTKEIRMNAPNTKLQTPEKLQISNLKLQGDRLAAAFETWSLEFLWSLVFGNWCFDWPAIGNWKSEI